VRLLAACIGIALAFLATAGRAECLKANTADQTAAGTLQSIVVTIPDYKLKEQAYIVTLATPACLNGPDEYDKVEKSSRIHVFTMDDGLRKRLRAFVGKAVRVTGEPFGEMTAHHHAPVVMRISAIEPLRK
jgi:hypothetical protein